MNYLVFDGLTSSNELVVDKLTSSLASARGQETNEMGFTSTERARLTYAWELYVSLSYNADMQRRTARFMFYLLTIIILATNTCSVVLTASGLQTDLQWHMTATRQSISLSDVGEQSLVILCAVLPILTCGLV